MTPTKLRQRLREGEFDPETYVEALVYVHDDGGRRRSSR